MTDTQSFEVSFRLQRIKDKKHNIEPQAEDKLIAVLEKMWLPEEEEELCPVVYNEYTPILLLTGNLLTNDKMKRGIR